MKATDRVREMYKMMNDAYGKEHADDMIINILYREQKSGYITPAESMKIYKELTEPKKPAKAKKSKSTKIVFKKVDDFTWRAEVEGNANVVEIKQDYGFYGAHGSYKARYTISVNGKERPYSYNKLSEARVAGKEFFERFI